jgi:hypothetical protein
MTPPNNNSEIEVITRWTRHDNYEEVSVDGGETWWTKEQYKALNTLLLKERLKVLEDFRVFCYEREAMTAWDTPQSNRQGWIDTKLRDFVDTLNNNLNEKESEDGTI